MAYIGFEKLVKKLAARGVKNPRALAAWIGRKKYGKKGFAKLSAEGRKKKLSEEEKRALAEKVLGRKP
jgi:hypothetical protein